MFNAEGEMQISKGERIIHYATLFAMLMLEDVGA